MKNYTLEEFAARGGSARCSVLYVDPMVYAGQTPCLAITFEERGERFRVILFLKPQDREFAMQLVRLLGPHHVVEQFFNLH